MCEGDAGDVKNKHMQFELRPQPAVLYEDVAQVFVNLSCGFYFANNAATVGEFHLNDVQPQCVPVFVSDLLPERQAFDDNDVGCVADVYVCYGVAWANVGGDCHITLIVCLSGFEYPSAVPAEI